MRVRITPDRQATAVSSEQTDADNGNGVHSGDALRAPEHWAHKQYRLTMTMLDSLECEEDEINVLAATILCRAPSSD